MYLKYASVTSRTKALFLTCSFRHLPILVEVVNREDELNGGEEEWAKVEPEADVEEAKELIELEQGVVPTFPLTRFQVHVCWATQHSNSIPMTELIEPLGRPQRLKHIKLHVVFIVLLQAIAVS